MNYKVAMAIIAELQTLVALLESPDARWKALQDWLDDHPRWRAKVGRYSRMPVEKASEDLKAFLIEQTEIPPAIFGAFITPEIEAQTRRAIERLQTLYKDRKAQAKQKEINA